MATYLLDTNIVLRFSNPSDRQHQLVVNAITNLLEQEHELVLVPQVLIEMWVVGTRPTDVNGLGWSTTYTSNIIRQLLERFPLIEEDSTIFSNWLRIVSNNNIVGKRTHDARIVATMQSAEITHILTLNPKDFSRIPDLMVVHPAEIV